MKARLTVAVASAAGLLAASAAGAVVSSPAHAQEGGFQISGTNLLDANGNNFVMRGTSLPYQWFSDEFQMFSDAASLGANTVRVVLGSGHQWGPTTPSEVADIVEECKQHAMVCMLEVHDATGYGDPDGQDIANINTVVDEFWSDPAMIDVLEGEEEYVLVNIANEPRGNENSSAWVQETTQAVSDMRSLGYDHTLVVDAPNWGQDWEFVMQDNAPEIADADPQGNTLFSIHMYEVFSSASNVTDYFDAFEQMGLPLIVGEFGHQHNGQDVAHEAVMSQAQQRGIGWIAWSWSGNSGGVEYLDQVNDFDGNSLTSWGETVFNSQNGVGQTAECATVYPDCEGSEPPTTTPPTTTPPTTTPPTTTPPTTPPTSTPPTTDPSPGDDCEVDYSANGWGNHPGFTANVTVTNTGSSSIDGWTLQYDYTAGQTVDGSGWNASVSQSGATVTAEDAGYNGTLAPGQSASFGYNGEAQSADNNPAPASFSLNGTDCTVG